MPPGTLVTGRYYGGRYQIQRLLGQGANGIVYLVKHIDSGGLYALKMGFDSVDTQSEINVLKALKKQGYNYLIEVDDYSYGGRDIPFYVMRYVKGDALRSFIAGKGVQWLKIAGLHLLGQLQRLHDTGWVFGDLKPENVLVGPYGEVELIDYGGVTKVGSSVKQFTEWYDRGFWDAGSRTAHPTYDLFSFAVVCLHLLAEEPLKRAALQIPQNRSKSDLLAIINREAQLAPYRNWLRKAVMNEFQSTSEAHSEWKSLITDRSHRHKTKPPTPRWLVGAFVLSLTMLACAVSITLWF